MKSLDEVIKANECCDHGELDSRCEDCPYNGIGACCAERESDALHYLRIFQAHEQRVRDQLDALKDEYRPNDPLTWEQLKQMEGKPVWVEQMESGKAYGKWLLVQTLPCLGDVYMVSRYRERILLYESEMGKTWQAYRKERE